MLGSLQDAGNTATLAGYINLMDESGLLCGLQKFSIDTARRKASIPKLQVYNNALKTVGDGGIGVEDFLSMDIRKLF